MNKIENRGKFGWSALLRAGGITLFWMGMLFVVLQFLPEGGIWNKMSTAKAGQYAEYCELNHMGELVRQPMNSWSNFIYLFFGLLVLRHRRTAGEAAWIRTFPAYAALMAFAFFFLCSGSFFFHASLTRIAQRMDMTGTYGLAMVLILGMAYRLGEGHWWTNSRHNRMKLIGLGALSFIFFFLVKWHLSGKIVLPAIMLTVAVSAIALMVQRPEGQSMRWLIIGLVAVALAGLCRSLDLQKVGCGPESLFQFHALWHGFTGLSGFACYMFLGSGKKV